MEKVISPDFENRAGSAQKKVIQYKCYLLLILIGLLKFQLSSTTEK